MSKQETVTHQRIDWVDYARGICIVMVVTFYAAGYIGEILNSTGWMSHVVEFAAPFRMPDFFLISGLFVSRALVRKWRDYLDTKVVHFLYFYALWVTIKFVTQNAGALFGEQRGHLLQEYLLVYVEPHGPLWFIYMLPVFFVVTRLVSTLPAWLVLAAAVALKLADLDTGWKLVDRFGMYFVFFYSGYLFSAYILRFARWAGDNPRPALAGLLGWAVLNAVAVRLGMDEFALGHLLTGYVGSAAVILCSTMLVRFRWMDWLRYLGAHSIVIYLGFVIPMGLMRRVVQASGSTVDAGTMAFIAVVVSVMGALLMYWAVRNTWFSFLFDRPEWASIRKARRVSGVGHARQEGG